MATLPLAATLSGTGALTAQTKQLQSIAAGFSGAGALTANLTQASLTVLINSGALSGGRVAIPTLIGNSDFLLTRE
jgi:hypothetical protein